MDIENADFTLGASASSESTPFGSASVPPSFGSASLGSSPPQVPPFVLAQFQETLKSHSVLFTLNEYDQITELYLSSQEPVWYDEHKYSYFSPPLLDEFLSLPFFKLLTSFFS